jgi:lysozyme family protein
MSTLVFDGTAHTLTLLDAQHKKVGHWHANNRVDSRATFHFVPNRTYRIIDPSHPFRHGPPADTLNGPYGRFGIIRLQHFTAEGHGHDGVGVHSGRANKGGPDHATMGCIRTTDEAMEAIVKHMRHDPIHSITVEHNHRQGQVLPHKGDQHHHVDPLPEPPKHPHEKHHKAHDSAPPQDPPQPAPQPTTPQHMTPILPAHQDPKKGHQDPKKGHHTAHKKHALPDYQNLFDTCVINASHMKEIDAAADKIAKNKARYEALVKGMEGNIPWWFVGLVHKQEGGSSFKTHLHNGDPLSARTVHVPKGRPVHGTPPFTWEESAEDALRYDKVTAVTEWTLPNALHKLEAYNGFGYLNRGINSPYLWSYSNHYTKGKYVADGVWDPEAVSRQSGAAVVLKRMMEKGAVNLG